MSVFASLSPLKESQCFLWSLFVQSLTALLATSVGMPQADTDPANGVEIPV
jgi:hypothetical protein